MIADAFKQVFSRMLTWNCTHKHYKYTNELALHQNKCLQIRSCMYYVTQVAMFNDVHVVTTLFQFIYD
jgi:hypothetical protein